MTPETHWIACLAESKKAQLYRDSFSKTSSRDWLRRDVVIDRIDFELPICMCVCPCACTCTHNTHIHTWGRVGRWEGGWREKRVKWKKKEKEATKSSGTAPHSPKGTLAASGDVLVVVKEGYDQHLKGGGQGCCPKLTKHREVHELQRIF